ncbi:MAG: hypothetical protein JF599_11525, partial [Verrucomicrobia bacterium]|nr:hypothetical protein [Verrucomicrobiota bacterium]
TAAHNASITGITQSAQSLLGQVTFTIPSINLPPGKQKIYSIASNQNGSPNSASSIALSEGDVPNVAYMVTAASSGPSGWPIISTIDGSANKYTMRMTDSGNFSISLLDATDTIVTKHQHVDMIGNSATEGTQDWITRDEAALSYKPLGGVDYYPIWPGQGTSAAEKGVQVFADYNLRAANLVMPKSSMPRSGLGSFGNGFHTRPPYYAAVRTSSGAGVAQRDQFAVGFTPAYWGYNYNAGSIQEVVLFDVPRRDPANDGGTLLSLGFLQHANLTADDENLNVGHQPGAAFGNSRFNPFVRQREIITGGALDNTYPNNNVYDAYVLQGDPSASVVTPAPTAKTRFFDMSYLLNTALWDSYYFSTLPQNAASTASFTPGVADLPNSRLTFTAGYVPTKADLGLNGGSGTDHSTGSRTMPGESTPARYQMIEGAFNVNSTSIQAWRSLLASLRTAPLKNPAYSPAWSAVALNAFPRAVYPWAKAGSLPTSGTAGQDPEDYAGFRDLTDAQLEALAEKIVLQVRMRGPFLSLAHFINRSLHDTDTACLAGPLQAAIDATTGTSILNRPADTTGTFTGAGTTVYPTTPSQVPNAVPNRLTGLPGWLSQADILQAVGPVLSARSDTFCIRVYGEVRDPLNASAAAPLARAWCEATVQRYPDYVDSTNLSSDTLATTGFTSANQNFGRRFRVVSFRWLTPSDI